jgi:hypothetical protein
VGDQGRSLPEGVKMISVLLLIVGLAMVIAYMDRNLWLMSLGVLVIVAALL